MERDITEYLDRYGVSPFQRWFDGLDARAAAKVRTSLARLQHGNTSNLKAVGGGTKARQSRDIDAARTRWTDYKARKRAGE